MAKAPKAKGQEAVLGEFAFFKFLWTFYRQNRAAKVTTSRASGSAP